jgi:hypothetical protein
MLFYLVLIVGTLLLSKKLIAHTRHTLHKRKNGCADPPSYPHRDPIWGIDLFIKQMRALNSGTYLESSAAVRASFSQSKSKSKTYMSKSFGSTIYHTTNPEVVKIYQSICFHDFGIEPLRYHLAENLWGNGIVVADGQRWADARRFIRGSFDVVHTANIDRLEYHVAKFMDLIPRDGTTVDLMPLFKRLVSRPNSEQIGQYINKKWLDSGYVQ